MRNFKIGDKVKIPSEPDSEWKFWIPEMDEHCGKTQIVTDLNDKEYSDPDFIGCIDLDGYTYRLSYLLTEPYNQSEQTMEIDLEKEQIFTEPLEGYEFSNDGHTWSESKSLKAILKSEWQGLKYYTSTDLKAFWQCRKRQETPKSKTRPLTHFEILKMDAVFRSVEFSDKIHATWDMNKSSKSFKYCLKSDFQKAQSLEDVVWKPLTTEEL